MILSSLLCTSAGDLGLPDLQGEEKQKWGKQEKEGGKGSWRDILIGNLQWETPHKRNRKARLPIGMATELRTKLSV